MATAASRPAFLGSASPRASSSSASSAGARRLDPSAPGRNDPTPLARGHRPLWVRFAQEQQLITTSVLARVPNHLDAVLGFKYDASSTARRLLIPGPYASESFRTTFAAFMSLRVPHFVSTRDVDADIYWLLHCESSELQRYERERLGLVPPLPAWSSPRGVSAWLLLQNTGSSRPTADEAEHALLLLSAFAELSAARWSVSGEPPSNDAESMGETTHSLGEMVRFSAACGTDAAKVLSQLSSRYAWGGPPDVDGKYGAEGSESRPEVAPRLLKQATHQKAWLVVLWPCAGAPDARAGVLLRVDADRLSLHVRKTGASAEWRSGSGREASSEATRRVSTPSSLLQELLLAAVTRGADCTVDGDLCFTTAPPPTHPGAPGAHGVKAVAWLPVPELAPSPLLSSASPASPSLPSLSLAAVGGGTNRNAVCADGWAAAHERAGFEFEALLEEREAIQRAHSEPKHANQPVPCDWSGDKEWSRQPLQQTGTYVRLTSWCELTHQRHLLYQPRPNGVGPLHTDAHVGQHQQMMRTAQSCFLDGAFPAKILCRAENPVVSREHVKQYMDRCHPWFAPLRGMEEQLMQVHLACVTVRWFDLRPALSLYAPPPRLASGHACVPGDVLRGDGQVFRRRFLLVPLDNQLLGLTPDGAFAPGAPQGYCVQPCTTADFLPTDKSLGAAATSTLRMLDEFCERCCEPPSEALAMQSWAPSKKSYVFRNGAFPELGPPTARASRSAERAVERDAVQRRIETHGSFLETPNGTGPAILVRSHSIGHGPSISEAERPFHAAIGELLGALAPAGGVGGGCGGGANVPSAAATRVGQIVAHATLHPERMHPGFKRFAEALYTLVGGETPLGSGLDRAAECIEEFVEHGATAPEVKRLRGLDALASQFDIPRGSASSGAPR